MPNEQELREQQQQQERDRALGRDTTQQQRATMGDQTGGNEQAIRDDERNQIVRHLKQAFDQPNVNQKALLEEIRAGNYRKNGQNKNGNQDQNQG